MNFSLTNINFALKFMNFFEEIKKKQALYDKITNSIINLLTIELTESNPIILYTPEKLKNSINNLVLNTFAFNSCDYKKISNILISKINNGYTLTAICVKNKLIFYKNL